MQLEGRGRNSPAPAVHMGKSGASMPYWTGSVPGWRDDREAYRGIETESRVPPPVQQGPQCGQPLFVLYCRPNRRSYSRLGITTGVKLGNAVKRNRARRRIRELYRVEEQALLPGYDIVVVARTRVIYGKYADLQRSFRRLTEKLELRRGREAGEAL